MILTSLSTAIGRVNRSHVSLLGKSATLIGVLLLSGSLRAQDDPAAEDKFFSVMNEVRATAGLPLLKSDPHLKDAARLHLAQFVKIRELSHQFTGEPDLRERLKMAHVAFGSTGEILLMIADLNRPLEELISGEARQVLLNPKLSAADVAAMRSGTQLYVVANLIQPLQKLTMDEVEGVVLEAVQQLRKDKKIMPLNSVPTRRLRSVACEMAKKDLLKVVVPNPTDGGYIGSAAENTQSFAFTSLDPRDLPQSILTMPHNPKINTIQVGACFASSKTYPDGIYWIIVQVYGTGLGKRF